MSVAIRRSRDELLAELTDMIVRFGLHEDSGLIYEVGTRVVDKYDPAKSPSFLRFVLSAFKFYKIDLYRLKTHRGRDTRTYVPIEEAQIRHEFRDYAAIPEPPSSLTPNESQVWTMLAAGLRYSQIAQRLGKSESCVSLYTKSIEKKVAHLYGRTPRQSRVPGVVCKRAKQ